MHSLGPFWGEGLQKTSGQWCTLLSKVSRVLAARIFGGMDQDEIQDAIAAYARKIASLGGKARAKKLSAERRKEIAMKASKAAAKARSKKAAKPKKDIGKRMGP